MCRLEFVFVCRLAELEGLWILSFGLLFSFIINLGFRILFLLNFLGSKKHYKAITLSGVIGISLSVVLRELVFL